MNEQMNEWMNEQMNEWMNEWMNEQMNEWMNEWTNEWMNEWMNKWMNEWMNLLTYWLTTKHLLNRVLKHMQFWHECYARLHIHASNYTERKIRVHACMHEWMNKWMNYVYHIMMVWSGM
jgi:hypothetical protein